MGRDHAGEGSREHQDEQPGDTLLGVGPDAGAEVGGGIVVGQNSCHLLHIFGALIGQDVDRVVDGDDTDEHALVVQNRHRSEVVALHLAGHILLVIRDLHGDDIVVHDVHDGGRGVRQQQAAGRHDALQAVALHHIAGIDRLGVLTLLADSGEGVTDGHLLPQTDVFGGHQAAGRALGVVQQLVQALTGLAGRLFQHPLDHACGHIFQQVGGVVKAHIFDGAHQLDVGESIHEVVAGLIGHIGECLRCNVLFQQTEHHEAVVLVQLFQQLGQVGGLLFLGHFAQLDVLLLDEQLEQTALGQHLGVGLDFFVVGLLFFGLADVLLEVFGGLLVQVFGQLLAHLSGNIRGQLLHRKSLFLFALRGLLFFFHLCSSSFLSQEDTAVSTQKAPLLRCRPRAALPICTRKAAPLLYGSRTADTPLFSVQKRRTQHLSRSLRPHHSIVFDYDPGPLSCVHLHKFVLLSFLAYKFIISPLKCPVNPVRRPFPEY
ncbi:Uncharacterised protein [Faecalibacterium prausnitzii]|nr:Uncharacterised protein [Faecalibacterium prausnitzii]